jgi:hypothetical protein
MVININMRPGQIKKLELRRQIFSMLIFLGVEKVVDVNHLRSSMLIFSMLLPHPIIKRLSILWQKKHGGKQIGIAQIVKNYSVEIHKDDQKISRKSFFEIIFGILLLFFSGIFF